MQCTMSGEPGGRETRRVRGMAAVSPPPCHSLPEAPADIRASVSEIIIQKTLDTAVTSLLQPILKCSARPYRAGDSHRESYYRYTRS